MFQVSQEAHGLTFIKALPSRDNTLAWHVINKSEI